MKKINVGILFGGKSAEHEVSLQSAKNIVEAIDRDRYDITLIGIDKDGGWHYLADAVRFLLNSGDPEHIALQPSGKYLAVNPAGQGEKFFCVADYSPQNNIDVIFPVLHGSFGEDGTVQGLLKLAGIPFVGAGVLGSAVGMDKDVMKRLWRDAGLPLARFLVFHKRQENELDFAQISRFLGSPVFVKPANAGSSVGIGKAASAAAFAAAASEAFAFDNKIIVEEAIQGARELECAVLGNEEPIASGIGEILLHADFYSYRAKYLDKNGAEVKVPADLPPAVAEQARDLALQAFRVVCCEGMARVDFFLTKENKILLNEINTIPGFTNISMYPRLWREQGLAYGELIHRLIQLALERHARESRLKTSF
ncbi:MAG: D-alanine--D-alanine ligase [Acidaminococcales bacterium]|jgi:D-alanine-D-alanine ligase|nr:D-alanine--D-alanine ligase [Acidaminococcales bacterium]